MTQNDRINNMSIDEKAEFFNAFGDNICHACFFTIKMKNAIIDV